MSVSIAVEPVRQPEVIDLLDQSDCYMQALYPPESNHLVDLATLERQNVRFLVARHAGAVVGCAALVLAGDGTAEIKRMFVDPKARGLKIGRLLLDALDRTADAEGLTAIRLETGIHQPEAIGLYRSGGYVEIDPFGDYRPDPLSLFMEKPLNR